VNDQFRILPLTKPFDQIAVDLHDLDLARTGEQLIGQNPEPGADLQDTIFGIEIGSAQDTFNNLPVAQKILAEAFTWTMG
jgi:hypothetical protein